MYKFFFTLLPSFFPAQIKCSYSHSYLKITQPNTCCRERNFTPTLLSVLSWICAKVHFSKAMWTVTWTNCESLITQISKEYYYISVNQMQRLLLMHYEHTLLPKTKTLPPYTMEKNKKVPWNYHIFTGHVAYTMVLWNTLEYYKPHDIYKIPQLLSEIIVTLQPQHFS